MTYTFSLDTASFKTYPKICKIIEIFLEKNNVASSEKDYNQLIHTLVGTLKQEKLQSTSQLFHNETRDLSLTSPLIEQTPWGGVSIKKVDTGKDFIQKLLIIRQYGILGFEIHKKKLEKLHILEGLCILISPQRAKKKWRKGDVTISLGKVGDKTIIQPGDEHGIIALTNCVIEETSTNYLDDLVFIFSSKQVI